MFDPNPLSDVNFRQLEVASRYRDPQLQVGENYWYCFNLKQHIRKSMFKHLSSSPSIQAH